jgi:hypothetical protein
LPVRRSAAATLLLLSLSLLLPSPTRARGEERPPWWDNTIGMEPVVLPGFAPLEVSGTELVLGGRRYVWGAGFLPERIDSLGRPLTGPLELVARQSGERRVLRAERVRVASQAADQATVVAEGEALPGLRVVVTTRVEYDGVALVTLELLPSGPVEVGGLDFEVETLRTPAMRMLRFDAATVRYQPRKRTVALEAYAGPFQNAVGFPDGERSFWWFADNAEGWIWNAPTVTEVEPGAERVLLRQRLIGSSFQISEPLRMQFGFLATPVRELGGAWRKEQRIVALADRAHAGLGKLHLWWGSAFAHIDLPYTEYPPGVEEELPRADRAAYPGPDANAKTLERTRRELGITRVPYFSAHCLSALDPALRRYRAEWEIQPPIVPKGGLAGMTARVDKPCLSHRARPYTNYLLARFDEVLSRLPLPGLYFDQGPVLDSRNPAHGAWRDSQGRTHASLDILGLREFLKRLRVLFHSKGLPGLVFVHNSNSEIVPAYTFATATVDGEQARHHLKGTGDDYIAVMPLEQVRSQLAPAQYGVPAVWLPEPWTLNADDADWEGSDDQRRAFRNQMTLALLHDVPVWPVGFPLEGWRRLVGALDAFGVERADFVGYWSPGSALRTTASEAAVSYYRRTDPPGLLAVVGNLSPREREIPVEIARAGLGWTGPLSVREAETGEQIAVPGEVAPVRVGPKDFALVLLAPGT